MTDAQATPEPREDPLLRSARREALVTAALSLAALVYTIAYAAWFGYGRSAESLTFVLGVPDWVFWGVLVPWGVYVAISWWFSYWFVEDDVLERAEPTPTDGPSELVESYSSPRSPAERFPPDHPEGS